MKKRKVKKPSELAKRTWEYNGKTYYQVGCMLEAEAGRYSATAIEEGVAPNDDGEYRCVEIYFNFGDDGRATGIAEVRKSRERWDGVEGGPTVSLDELMAEGMTFDEFADAVRGCDCTEANVMSHIDVGDEYFTFDCDMTGPNGRVCVSGTMTRDEDFLITDVEDITVRDFSKMEPGDSYEDAPIIDDPDEVGLILEKFATRFTHENEVYEPDPPGALWSL